MQNGPDESTQDLIAQLLAYLSPYLFWGLLALLAGAFWIIA